MSIPWWFFKPFDSMLRFMNLQIFISSLLSVEIFQTPSWISHVPNYHRTHPNGIMFKQLYLPFQLSLHNKSSTDHRQQFRIILQSHQINTYMIANIPLINKTNSCIYWWMWFHNRLSSNKQQYDFINLRKKICKFVNLSTQPKGLENHQGIDMISNWGEAMCSSWIIFIVLMMRWKWSYRVWLNVLNFG